MNQFEILFKKDMFTNHVGIKLLEISEGSVRARMEIKPHHQKKQ